MVDSSTMGGINHTMCIKLGKCTLEQIGLAHLQIKVRRARAQLASGATQQEKQWYLNSRRLTRPAKKVWGSNLPNSKVEV